MQNDSKKQKSLLEFLVVRLDDAKVLLSLFNNNKEKFFELAPSLEETFERLETRCPLKVLLDENYGHIRSDSMFEVDDDYFNK